MKVPLHWLRELSPSTLSPEEIADLLTAHGVEVDDVRYPWAALTGVIVARVLDVRDHPDADKLCITMIDGGDGERQVVAGVRNMAPGDLVPYAAPGATLPGFDGRLERRTLRGQTSDGMLCSPKELAVSADHGGILILPQELEPGADLKRVLGLDDAVLDIEVHPNRPDLLSILGVARELAAATEGDLVPPDATVEEISEPARDAATVEVRDGERCPRYVARVIRGVAVGPAPIAAQVRLTAAGMRPVSNVVDATNYVLLEMGHPMHPFDLARLAGGGVVVRRATDGEAIVTLDGEERTLSGEDLVIADEAKAVGVAGIMGSAPAEVGPETSDVLLESAWFEPLGVLRTARRLGLRTEASVRFERGADPEAPEVAAARAARLIAAWAGGTVLNGAIDVGERPSRRAVAVRPARASLLLGRTVAAKEIRDALGRLRLPARDEGDSVMAEVPGYRVDLEREVDLIEEVARVTGYEGIPSSLPGIRQAGGLDPRQRLRRRVREAFASAGLLEAILPTFVSEQDNALYRDDRSAGIRVTNPISAADAALRTGLIPGLLRAAQRSLAHRSPSARLFEVGRVFSAEGPVEDERAAVILAGDASSGWPAEHRDHDFLDAKGILEHVLDAIGIGAWSLGEPEGLPYHPGRSVSVLVGPEVVGSVGEVHPSVAAAFDLTGRVGALEVRVGPLIEAAGGGGFQDLSRFPPTHRDLAFLVSDDVPAGEVRSAVVEAGSPLLERAVLFDVFAGPPLPEGKKSLAFSLDFRAPDRTLTDPEVEDVVAAITERVREEMGAELRAG